MSPCSVETVGETPQPWGAATSASDLMTVKLEKMSAVSADKYWRPCRALHGLQYLSDLL